jgi:hypothetical protein
MNKGLIFLCLSCGLLVLTIITICVAPIITGNLGSGWGQLNCQYFADAHKNTEDDSSKTKDQKDKELKTIDKLKHLCDREKAMYGLEYASLISDLVFGFSCTLLSLLHFFGVGKNFEKITGIIGLISGVIGFILTFIYIIYSGYIFTNDGPKKEDDIDSFIRSGSSSGKPKLDKNREFAKWDGSKYECLFYDKDDDDDDSLYPKWNDLGKKQYNYHKDFVFADADTEYKKCQLTSVSGITLGYNTDYQDLCKNDIPSVTTKIPNCDSEYIFYDNEENDVSNKYQYDKWVTSIIFGCIIILLNLGLAVFGFLIFKESDSSSGLVSLK